MTAKLTGVLLCIACWPAVGLAKAEVVDRVVAVVEDEIITLRELAQKIEPYLAQLDARGGEDDRVEAEKALYKRVLDLEISERLIDGEVQRNSALAVSEADVERAIDEVAQMNNISRDVLQSELYRQGMTWGEYRRSIKKSIARQRLIQFKVQGRVQIAEADVARACREKEHDQSDVLSCASHILVAVSEGSTDAAAKKEALEVLAQLREGGDFIALAARHNDDRASEGGRLGCFGRGEMVDAFEAAAFSLPIGQYSEPVRTPFGYHIIRVDERRSSAAGECDDEAVLEKVRQQMFQAEMERQMKVWVDELRAKSFVEVRL